MVERAGVVPPRSTTVPPGQQRQVCIKDFQRDLVRPKANALPRMRQPGRALRQLKEMGWVPRPSDQRWSMASPLTTVAPLASAIAGPLSATAPAAATPRLSRSSCRGFAGRRSGRPSTPSWPASAACRWLGASVEVGADDAVDERSRISASRYASVHMAAIAGRLSAVPGCGSGCQRDRGGRSRERRTADRSAPGRPRRRWPAADQRCRRGPWWPGGSSRRCPWPSSR